ncbi:MULTISPECIES: hypothetical protein [Streptomyces]|uniref:hypothetical protein n=1 Tax=Streptomyces TaxID=1883 RepID=UPI0013DD0E3A|nr:hypothetical protein [Streptomyces sp. SID10692]
MSTTLSPDGDQPVGREGPEQSGAEQARPQSVSKSFIHGMAEGAGQVLGKALAGAAVVGVVAGGLAIPEMQSGPHQGTGRAAGNCATA